MGGQNIRMHGPLWLSNTAMTKYAVPAGAMAVLQHIHVQNPSTTGVAVFTMSIGADSAATRIYDSYSVGPGCELDVFCKYVLKSGEIVQAFSNSSNVLTLTLDGQLLSDLPASSATPFNAIYEVDFTKLPSQSLSAAGSYTIDGKTWWAKGDLGSKGSASIVSSLGFNYTFPAPLVAADNSNWRTADPPNFRRVFCMPLAQLASFNPAAPLAFVCRLTSTSTIAADIEDRVYTGVIDVSANGNTVTASEHLTHMGISRYDNTTTWFTSNANSDSRNAGGAGASLPTYAQNVQGMYRFMSGQWYPLLGPWTGVLTVPDNHVSQVVSANAVIMANRCSASPSFYYTVNLINTTLPALDYYLTHLRIMQPRAAL